MTILQEGEIIPLTNNYMFIQMFYYHNDLLEYFISDYFNLPLNKVHNHITLQPRDSEKDNKLTSDMQLDLVLDLDGDKIDIELNNKKYKGLEKRNLTYIELLGGHQYKKNTEYDNIHAAILINLNNYKCNQDKLIKRYRLYDEDNTRVYSDNLRIDVVDLTKYDNNYKCFDMIEEKVYLWSGLITTNSIYKFKDICGKLFTKELARKMVDLVNRISSDMPVYTLGDEEDQPELIKHGLIAQAFDDGKEEGIEKGKEQGIEQKTKESAIELHKNGVSDEIILKSLNITKEKLSDYLKEK